MILSWLMEHGGPIIRWRTANELLPKLSDQEMHILAREVIETPLVQEWLLRLDPGKFPSSLDMLDATSLGKLGSMVHGSKLACLENVLGKLAEFGLKAGLPGLDERVLPLMRIFSWKPGWDTHTTYQNAWETLVKSVFAWGLLRMGYVPDTAMENFLLSHLEVCYKIARDQVYDIYADEKELIGLPKAWKGKQIIKQDVMANYWLPYIHDLYVFSGLPSYLLNENTRMMIDELVMYILNPQFQALKEGYGYAWIKERRACYGWGWSPHLKVDSTLIMRTELMAHFQPARKSQWFYDTLQFLESFHVSEGRYVFPAEYIREAEGYYVSGYGMGLGENRRKSASISIESTFRMLKIKSII